MKISRAGWPALLVAALLIQACSLVPITGRRQLSLVSDSDVLSLSFTQYAQFMKENKLSGNAGQANAVKQVGRRIQQAVTKYFAQNKLSQNLKGFKWEFNLIETRRPMPGACPEARSSSTPDSSRLPRPRPAWPW